MNSLKNSWMTAVGSAESASIAAMEGSLHETEKSYAKNYILSVTCQSKHVEFTIQIFFKIEHP